MSVLPPPQQGVQTQPDTVVSKVLARNIKNIQRKAGTRLLQNYTGEGGVDCVNGQMSVGGRLLEYPGGVKVPCAGPDPKRVTVADLRNLANAMGLPHGIPILGMQQLDYTASDDINKVLLGDYAVAAMQFLMQYVAGATLNANNQAILTPMRTLLPPFVNAEWACQMLESLGRSVAGEITKFEHNSPISAMVQNMVVTNELQAAINDATKYIVNGTKSMLLYGDAMNKNAGNVRTRPVLSFRSAADASNRLSFGYAIESMPQGTQTVVDETTPGMKTDTLATERKAATTALENWVAVQVAHPTKTVITWSTQETKFSVVFKMGQANSLNHSLLNVYRLPMYDVLHITPTTAAVIPPALRQIVPGSGGVVQDTPNSVVDAMLFGDVGKLEKSYPNATVNIFAKPSTMTTAEVRKCNRMFWKFISAGGSAMARLAVWYFTNNVLRTVPGKSMAAVAEELIQNFIGSLNSAVNTLGTFCGKQNYKVLAEKQVRRMEKDVREELHYLTETEVAPFSANMRGIGVGIQTMSLAYMHRKLAASIIPPDKEDVGKLNEDDAVMAEVPTLRIFADQIDSDLAPLPVMQVPFAPGSSPNLIATALGSKGVRSAMAMQNLTVMADEAQGLVAASAIAKQKAEDALGVAVARISDLENALQDALANASLPSATIAAGQQVADAASGVAIGSALNANVAVTGIAEAAAPAVPIPSTRPSAVYGTPPPRPQPQSFGAARRAVRMQVEKTPQKTFGRYGTGEAREARTPAGALKAPGQEVRQSAMEEKALVGRESEREGQIGGRRGQPPVDVEQQNAALASASTSPVVAPIQSLVDAARDSAEAAAQAARDSEAASKAALVATGKAVKAQVDAGVMTPKQATETMKITEEVVTIEVPKVPEGRGETSGSGTPSRPTLRPERSLFSGMMALMNERFNSQIFNTTLTYDLRRMQEDFAAIFTAYKTALVEFNALFMPRVRNTHPYLQEVYDVVQSKYKMIGVYIGYYNQLVLGRISESAEALGKGPWVKTVVGQLRIPHNTRQEYDDAVIQSYAPAFDETRFAEAEQALQRDGYINVARFYDAYEAVMDTYNRLYAFLDASATRLTSVRKNVESPLFGKITDSDTRMLNAADFQRAFLNAVPREAPTGITRMRFGGR